MDQQQQAAALVLKMREHRRFKLELKSPTSGKVFTFTLRRPTDSETNDLALRMAKNDEIARTFVEDWGSNVSVLDIPGAGDSDDLVKFSRQVWHQWCDDWEDCWNPISDAVLGKWTERRDQIKAAEKNS